MLKAQFSHERVQGIGLGFVIEGAGIKVQHPYNSIKAVQPTFTIAIRFYHWQYYFMVYKPAKVALNRKQRRANKFH